ncbi:MAG: amidohydrolase [Lachnospiraceae bacterium]|nr:amidohydrolase [Lachnospiraceae bacterium]
MNAYRLTEEEYARILDMKRDLHMHPELSEQEVRTTACIGQFLSTIPAVEILPLNIKTGVVARIRGTSGGTEVMLRADIDALPQTERYESPWKSVNEGVMHACGHDFHTAALLGAALLLARAKEAGDLKGTADLVFQPAEEGTSGAKMLIEAGLFEKIRPKMCFGIHNWPSIPTGKVACREGVLMAAKRNFDIHVYGAGGHGSMPHLNTDPIVCAAAVVQSLQTIVSRNTSPLDSVVLSVNMIQGGSPVNLVVDHVLLKGTIRSLTEEALDRAIERVETIVSHTVKAYECTSDIDWLLRVPAVRNAKECMRVALEAVAQTGCEEFDAPPSLASEDFALYRAYAPSFFYWVGSTAPGDTVEELHRPCFHTDDNALRHAAELYAATAILA